MFSRFHIKLWITVIFGLVSCQSVKKDGYQRILKQGKNEIYQLDAQSWIFTINLKNTAVKQVYGRQQEGDSSLFIKQIASPQFERIPYDSIIDTLSENYTAMINASFFEVYQDYTPLSFPIADSSKYITGGSSPYGPVNPKHPYYQDINLCALTIYEDYATIDTFQLDTQQLPKNSYQQLVSYRYEDHPALVLSNNRKTRFLLVGLMDKNQDSKAEYLVFIIAYGTITEVTKKLQEFGAEGTIMSFDGGSSVLFHNPKLGYLAKPHAVSKQRGDTIFIKKLPHYLYFPEK